MLDIQTVLHPTDFSECAKHAFTYALQVARQHDADLHLLHIGPSEGDDPIRSAYQIEAGDESVLKKMRDRAEERMMDLIGEVDSGGVNIQLSYSRGIAPGPEILRYAEKKAVDLVVMGTHGRRGVKRFILGSVAEEVVRQAPCSVLTVCGEAQGDFTPPTVDRMLVPVDLSEFTMPLLHAAKTVASAYTAEIDLLHVVEPLPFPAPLVGALTIHDLIPDPTDQATSQLEQISEQADGPDIAITPHVAEGHAAKVILNTAEELDSDLIMIASHGLSGLEGMLLGSVTARVLRKAQCPVWVARVQPENGSEEAA
jgi:nucleotide-binding universal stress UspA family protein